MRMAGYIDGRMRFPMEVFHSVRTVWPSDKPISAVRIFATDWLENGWTLDDSVYLARALKEGGCDIIDVSTGQTTSPILLHRRLFPDAIR